MSKYIYFKPTVRRKKPLLVGINIIGFNIKFGMQPKKGKSRRKEQRCESTRSKKNEVDLSRVVRAILFIKIKFYSFL
jgi:hypothetical protein